MAQTVARFRQEGDDIDYTPVSNTTAGTVVVLGNRLIGVTKLDITANTTGAIGIKGIFRLPKTNSAIARGDAVYWNSIASPVVGDASSGAANNTSNTTNYAGVAIAAQVANDAYVDVDLNVRGTTS